MAEATLDAAADPTAPAQAPSAEADAQAQALKDAAREIDRARMRQIGGYHFALVAGALTLWGAAQTWAQVTGSGLATLLAVANALVAGTVVVSIVHEWGHFTGARLSGAVSPVLEKPRNHFFMFDFDMGQNDVRQFRWMSWGGILAPFGAVLLALLLVPLQTLSGLVLVAMLISKAVAAAVFEVPIVRAADVSGNPGLELGARVKAGGLASGQRAGRLAGVAAFAVLWLLV